ncbi:MAG: Maf family nucleotide pyrophosphatase [Lentimicrobiaceae bacterium]|nr:Maf family nucleotide pyrophosphatase [Lentimicrobiaceae bacterium]
MIFDKIKNYRLLLASKSQRRIDLFKQTGLDFTVVDINADESFPRDLHVSEVPLHICQKKSHAYDTSKLKDNNILVTADTVVVFGDSILNKPHDEVEAKKMLSILSDKSHKVYTGVCIRNNKFQSVFVEETTVTFGNLSEGDIDFYVKNYKPFDKAGAYGIQEWIGLVGVERIEGCYYNIVGFPMHTFCKQLIKFIERNTENE